MHTEAKEGNGQKMRKKMVIGFGMILIFAVIVALGLYSMRSTPEKTLGQVEQSLNDRNVQKFVDCFTPNIQEQFAEYEKKAEDLTSLPISKYLDSLPLFSRLTTLGDEIPPVHLKTVEKEPDGDMVTMKIELTLEGKDTVLSGYVTMEKIGGKWLISSVRPII